MKVTKLKFDQNGHAIRNLYRVSKILIADNRELQKRIKKLEDKDNAAQGLV